MTSSSHDIDAGARRFDAAIAAARRVAAQARVTAAALDVDGAYPADDIAALADAGPLAAPLPPHLGGVGLVGDAAGAPALAAVLAQIGAGSLSLGHLYEGHVNALALIVAFGRDDQIAAYAALARGGRLFAVWNTDAADAVRIAACGIGRHRLDGAKDYASGAGFVDCPLITARDKRGGLFMLIGDGRAVAADLAHWRPHGMRASASGRADFTGLEISGDAVIGGAGDYHRQPLFSAGAWRFAAVQFGGIATLYDLARGHLVKTGRAANPHQEARLGAAALAVETARLWVQRACVRAAAADADPAAAVAFVNLARLAVERAGLDVLELTHRSVGLAGFMRPHPIERLSRDLATYLRQPAPDAALAAAAAYIVAADRPMLDLWDAPERAAPW